MSIWFHSTMLALLLLPLPTAPYPHHHHPNAPSLALPCNATSSAPQLVPALAAICSADGDLEEGLGASVAGASRRALLAAIQQRKQQLQPQPWAAPRQYISYAALRADIVPCSRPGVPYYNCLLPARANAYHRGCGTITRCARFDIP